MQISVQQSSKPYLHMPRDTVPPRLLSGAYIIGLVLTISRTELRVTEFTRHSVTKIYTRGRYSYICPQQGEALPEGYRWIYKGRKFGRDVWRAI